MQEDDVDICASPELDLNSGKPVFEDVDEFRDIQDNDLLDNSDDWGFKSNQETDGLGFRVSNVIRKLMDYGLCETMHK